MSTPTSPPPPDFEDLRGLARGLRLLVEIGARTLSEDAGPSELALRVTAHLGCGLPDVVPVTERFPAWENVNVQRGVDAYLAERHSDPDWFGAAGLGHRPHEDMLSLITMPVHFGPVRIMAGGVRAGSAGDLRVGAASYGTADVTFALTTNRADILETALADRPGRVDLAIEIPRPDAQCRQRLLQVYARDLALDADLDEVVAGSEGVTASFIKELIRRTVLVSLRAGERPPVLRGSHFAEVLAEMNSEHHALTRALLGAGADHGEPAAAEHRPRGRKVR